MEKGILPYLDLDIDGALGKGLSPELKDKIQKAVFDYTCEDCPYNFDLEGQGYPFEDDFVILKDIEADDLKIILFNFGDVASDLLFDQLQLEDMTFQEKNNFFTNVCICQAFGVLFEHNKFVITNNHINYCINHMDEKERLKYQKFINMKRQQREYLILNIVNSDFHDGRDPLFILRERLENLTERETQSLTR